MKFYHDTTSRKPNIADQKAVSTSVEPQAKTSKAPKDIIELIDARLKEVVAHNTALAAKQTNDGIITYWPQGYDFAVKTRASHSISLDWSSDSTWATEQPLGEKLLNVTRETLAELDFIVDTIHTIATIDSYISASNQLTCQIGNSPTASPFEVSCSTNQELASSTKNQADELQAFADAYRKEAKSPITDNSLLLSMYSKPTDSPITGYQRATVGINSTRWAGGGAGGLFYKVDNSWHFFQAVHSLPHCSEYNTTDLRNAFYGEKCYNQSDDRFDTIK